MAPAVRYGIPLQEGAPAAGLGALAERVGEWVRDGDPGAAVMLGARDGVVLLHEAYGAMGPDAGAPRVPRDAIFPIASISKPITATALMTLVEEGRVGVNRPVQEYVPEFRGEGKEAVLVHHLLTHTSGLSDAAVLTHVRAALVEVPAHQPESVRLFAQYLTYVHFDVALGAPLVRRPGAQMEYCSFGYSILGEILTRAAGRPYADVVRERVFEPLGMRDTFCEVPEAVWPRVVRRDPAGPVPHLNVRERLEHAVPQGGVSSTAWDVALFAQMFLDGGRPVLSRASAAHMTRNQIAGVEAVSPGGARAAASWGYGWCAGARKETSYHAVLASDRSYNHGGSGGSYVWADPDEGIVGVYLSVATRRRPDGAPLQHHDLFADGLTAALTAPS